jgi:VWFA-related protein
MLRLFVALTLAGVGAIAGANGQGVPATPIAASLLHISAVAVDRDERPVTDLQKEDLEVWIGGYRVPIERLTAVTASSDERSGRLIVLLLDDMTLEPVLTSRVREIARRFVNRMAPGDQMGIVTLNGRAMESTGDRTRLLRSIDTSNLQPGGIVRLDVAGEHVLETIASLSRQLAQQPGGRKTIVGIGAAWLFDTPIPPPTVGRDLRREWTDAMRATASADAHLYVIDPSGVGASPPMNGSSGFARETGGHAFWNTNDFNGAVDRIMREAWSYYVITVADPPVRRTSDLRELDVRLLRRGVTVRARRAILGRP